MQEKNSLYANLVLKKLKKALKINTDIQLSEFLNIKPNTISSWKKRNTLDYGAIISICELYEIDLNEIFIDYDNQKVSYSSYSSETPLVSRDVQFQYCLGSEGLLDVLPKYHFPFVQGKNTRAFQILGTNMAPLISENSYAVCEAVDLKDLTDLTVVVVISRVKGFFINRIARHQTQSSTYILSSENLSYNPITIQRTEIDEVWLVKGLMSYNIAPHTLKNHSKSDSKREVQKKNK